MCNFGICECECEGLRSGEVDGGICPSLRTRSSTLCSSCASFGQEKSGMETVPMRELRMADEENRTSAQRGKVQSD